MLREVTVFKMSENFEWNMPYWLRCWIPNPWILSSKPMGGPKGSLASPPSNVDQMNPRTSWRLIGKT